MSLRLRLTILYSALTGGILLIFGVLVFFLVSFQMQQQVDDRLVQSWQQLSHNWRVSPTGAIVRSFATDEQVSTDISFQLWSARSLSLVDSSPSISMFRQPLDSVGFQSGVSVYRDSRLSWGHLRVLTVPLLVGGRPIGVLQVAASMSLVDTTRQALLEVIAVTAVLATLFAALLSWFVIGQALAPLSSITESALAITHTDDLTQRLPTHGNEEDEIGRLVAAFNETLERLENLFSSQQRFLADVSHELRTPLTVIKGNVDLLRRIKQLDEESLATIEEEADRLTRLVGNLLLEAQAESGKLPLHFAPVELDTLLLEVFKEMRVLARERVNIRLTEIDQIIINGDRDRLKQVLINLVSNAIKYTPPGGNIFLSLSRLGDNARVIVRDTGQGISSEDLPHIFERFFRAEKSRTRTKTGGFGLGLSIAAWIVDHHGGRIEVDSAENQGSTFCIYLPIAKSQNPTLTTD